MHKYLFYITVAILLFASCASNSSSEEVSQNDIVEIDDAPENTQARVVDIITEPENIYIADLDMDSIPDSFFVIVPQINESENEYAQDCNGPCITKISFGDKLPPIYAQQSIGGEVEVLEDINENGYLELVFFPYWFQSCWSRMDIFSFDGKEWNLVRSIDYNSCEENLPTSFEKIDKGLLRVITNGEYLDESVDSENKDVNELMGLEPKIYDVEIN